MLTKCKTAIYKGSGMMMGLDGKVYGQCSSSRETTLRVSTLTGPKEVYVGMFRCKCKWSTDDINRAR